MSLCWYANWDQNEVGGFQKRDRSSCVSSLWNVALQSWKIRSSRLTCCQTLRNEIETRSSRVVRTNFGSEDIEWWVSDACYVVIALAFLDGQINRLCRTTVFAFGWHPFWTHPLRSYSQMFHTLTSQRNCGPPSNPCNGCLSWNWCFLPWIGRATNSTQTPKKNKEWILELSFGNAGPSSEADLYKSMPRSAFKSMSLWMNHGVQKVEPPESHWLLANPV